MFPVAESSRSSFDTCAYENVANIMHMGKLITSFSRSQHKKTFLFFFICAHFNVYRTAQIDCFYSKWQIPRIERKKTNLLRAKWRFFGGVRDGSWSFLAKRLRFRFLIQVSCSLYMILAAMFYKVASQVFNKCFAELDFAELDFQSSHKPTPCIRCFNS